MAENEYNKDFYILLNNLRILSCTINSEYLATTNENNFYCRYSKNWWNTLSDLIRLETWNCTHTCILKIYCKEIPKYISELSTDKDKNQMKIADLRSYCVKALVGLNNLKDTYNTTYQNNNGGVYDNEFDTIIQSYAKIQIATLNKLCEDISYNKS